MRKHDLAYLCFLPPAIVSLISAAGTIMPINNGIAGGAGMLILIPLSIISMASIPIGIFLSVLYRRDIVLPVLSILTMLLLAELVSETGSATFYNASVWVYGMLVILLEIRWFLKKRPSHAT